jgi:hypothetical protein
MQLTYTTHNKQQKHTNYNAKRHIHKISFNIGSGPIVIGQAIDYAGSQSARPFAKKELSNSY